MTQLPPRPDPDQLRRQAKDLLRSARSNDSASLSRLAGVPAGVTLSAAQFALAQRSTSDYGTSGALSGAKAVPTNLRNDNPFH